MEKMIVGRNDHPLVRELYERRSNQSVLYALDAIQQSALAIYVKHVYFFGSCARKGQTYESDVDLLLELDLSFRSCKNKREFIVDLRRALERIDVSLPRIDLKIVVGYGWKTTGDLFFRFILKEGIQLL